MKYTKNSFTKNFNKKSNYYLSKIIENKIIIFILQSGLKNI